MNERTAAGQRGMGFWLRAFSIQANVVGALLMRELHTRYGRENVGYLWLMLEPMTLAVAVGSIHAAHPAAIVSDIRPVPLATLGYCMFIMFRSIFTRSEGAIEANMPLLYHRQVTIFDILLSRALLDGIGTATTTAVLIFFGVATGLCDWPYRPLDLMGSILFMMWFSFAASMICCAWTHERRLVARLVHPGTYILMPLSGAFFMISWIPEPYRTWLNWFPMTHIFELGRHGMFRSASDLYYDIPFLTGCCMLMTVLGLLSVKIVRRHIHLQ